jgi:hypothetical protein
MPPFATTAPGGARRALLVKKEIALLDVRPENRFAPVPISRPNGAVSSRLSLADR